MSKDNFMLRKIATAAGAVVGVGTALWIAIFLPFAHDREMPVMLLCLSLAIVCGIKLMLNSYRRPLGQAFDLGYETGRKDAIREANRRGVSPVRKAPNGLTAFNVETTPRRRTVNGHNAGV
jgi:putative exporter of polyketide antibiotics